MYQFQFKTKGKKQHTNIKKTLVVTIIKTTSDEKEGDETDEDTFDDETVAEQQSTTIDEIENVSNDADNEGKVIAVTHAKFERCLKIFKRTGIKKHDRACKKNYNVE